MLARGGILRLACCQSGPGLRRTAAVALLTVLLPAARRRVGELARGKVRNLLNQGKLPGICRLARDNSEGAGVLVLANAPDSLAAAGRLSTFYFLLRDSAVDFFQGGMSGGVCAGAAGRFPEGHVGG